MRKFRHDISIIPPKDVRFSGKSLSEYELILALIEKVNELIKYTNSVAELVYALEKWINDEFINAIDESTKKTLVEWRESGYLQELVEDYLVNLTVAISEILDEEEQKFEKSWHPILDTKVDVEEVELYGKTYNKYTFKKGVSNDIFTITRFSISERQTHDSYVELFNLGKGFKIKDAISGKYVNVEEYEELSPEIDALPIKKYKLRNVYANLTFELDEDVEQIEVILFNSSIRSKVNIDEGFIWLVSRMDKLEDDMVVFEQWVREFVTTKITELENKVNKQIDDTIEYVDTEIIKNKNYVDQEVTNTKNYVDQEVTNTKNYVDQEVTKNKNYVDQEVTKIDKKKKDKIKNERIINFMMPNGHPTSFMHRGWSSAYPENSLLSFKKAGDVGATGIELDVHVTSDNQFIVIHDNTVDRVTNGTGSVNNMTLNQLKQLKITTPNASGRDLAVWIDKQVEYQQQGAGRTKDDLLTLLTLEEAIEIAQGYNMKMLIETKGYWTTTNFKKLTDLIVRRNMIDQCVIFSFNNSHLNMLRTHNKEILIGYITSSLSNSDIDVADSYENCLISFNYNNTEISSNNTLLNRAKSLSIPLTAYTVNDRKIAKSLYALGISITSDYYSKLEPSPYVMTCNYRMVNMNNIIMRYEYGSGDVVYVEPHDATTLIARLPVSSYDRFLARVSMSGTGGDKYRAHARSESRYTVLINFYEINGTTTVPLSSITSTIWFSLVLHTKM